MNILHVDPEEQQRVQQNPEEEALFMGMKQMWRRLFAGGVSSQAASLHSAKESPDADAKTEARTRDCAKYTQFGRAGMLLLQDQANHLGNGCHEKKMPLSFNSISYSKLSTSQQYCPIHQLPPINPIPKHPKQTSTPLSPTLLSPSSSQLPTPPPNPANPPS